MSYSYLLMGAEAAGFGMSLWGTSQANRMIGMGANLDKQALDLRMQQNTLASTEAAIANQERLRETIGLQAVMFAARGQRGGAGTAAALQNKSLIDFGREERARQLNLLFANQNIKGQKAQIGIAAAGQKAGNWGGLMTAGLQNLSFNSAIEKLQEARGKL